VGELSFRSITHDDLPLLHEWLQRPHVRRWWSDHPTVADIIAHYAPAIDGDDPTDLYFVLVDEQPAGFLQTYLLRSYPEYATLTQAGDGAAGADIFIADEQLTGKGLGSEVLRRFVDDVVFRNPEVTHCVADPDAENLPSIRAFTKAGFRAVREYDDPGDGKRHVLVRKDRSRPEAASRHALERT
jgi:RimJ/RimL family protein N-acetyltransferase